MESNDKEIYEIIASMPIDLRRIGLLGDVVYEAQLLIKSRFVNKVDLDLNGFLRISDYNKYGNILLVTEVEGRRFVIYIENDKIVSIVVSEVKEGTRHSGVRALALLLQLLKLKPLSFKVFEIVPELNDVTEDVSRRTTRTARSTITPATVDVKARGKVQSSTTSATVVFAEKLVQFRDRVKQVLQEIASVSGCVLQDVKVNVSKGTINIHVVLKKKLFFKCKVEEFKENARKDVELLMEMFDLALPFNITVESI